MLPSFLQLLLLIFFSHGLTKHLTMGQSDDSSRNITEVNYDERDDAPLVRAEVPVLSNESFPWLNESEDKETIMEGGISFRVDVYQELFRNENQRAVGKYSSHNWPTSPSTGRPTVPYFINIAHKSRLKNLVQGAIDELNVNTCIKFKHSSVKDVTGAAPKNALFIRHDRKLCTSEFGHDPDTLTYMHIGLEECQTKSYILEGIATALGLLPEYMHPNWKDWITYSDDDLASKASKFSSDVKSQGFPYDYTSVQNPYLGEKMGAGSVPVRTNDIIYQGLLRRRQTHLSHRDKESINRQYNCIETWTKYYNCQQKIEPCLNEGYTGPNCKCVCRPGTEGKHCQVVSMPDYYGHLLPSCSRDIKQATTIQSPGYPQDIPYDSWCVFKILAPEDHTIKVRFTDFHLAKTGDDCIESFLEIREESFRILGKVFCGEEIHPDQEFTSASNEMAIYLDVRNDNSRGFAADIVFSNAALIIASSYIYVSLIFTLFGHGLLKFLEE